MLVETRETLVQEYQQQRLRDGASQKTINEEVMVLFQIMGDAGDAVRLRLKRRNKLKR